MSVELKLAIGSFSVAPFLWPHLADKLTVDWDDPNIADCKVYLEAQEGSRVLLNDNEPGVAKYRPSGNSTRYAGSWAQDYGAGVATDQGTDSITPDGISSAVMADSHLSHAFQLLRDRTAKYLVYVITPVDSAQPVVVKQPRFEYTKSAQRQTIYENAHQCAVIHPDGPGVRYGQMDTGTSGTLTNPPNVYDGATRPNAIDWRIYHRLSVQGIAHDDGLTTEIAADRDTFEGQSVGNERSGSFGFLLPNNGESANWFVALVAALAEIPPLAMLPRRERNENTWVEDGGFCQHAWVWGQEPDYFVSAKYPTLLEVSGSDWTTTYTAPLGWKVRTHSHAVNNSETGAKATQNGTELAELRPFRGFYVVADFGANQTVLANTHTHWGHYHRLGVSGSDVTHSRAEYVTPSYGFEEESPFPVSVTSGGITYTEDGLVMATVSDGTDSFVYETYDDGRTYKYVATPIVNAIMPRSCVTGDGVHVIVAFRYDSGSSGPGKLYMSYMGPGDTAYSSAVAVTDGTTAIAFEDSGHDISRGPDETLVLTGNKSGDTDITDWYSHDLGATWTES